MSIRSKILLCCFFLGTTGMNTLWASNCIAEKARFKELYIALQQSLNYEGKDAHLINGALVLKPHKPDAVYEGKLFEAALYKEYQLSLKKVAALYQSAKFESSEKSNPALLSFVKAIDGSQDEISAYIKNNKVDAVIDQLQAASKLKYKDSKNSALINDNDKYLLKKLLTHAQDRICSVNKFEETEQKTGKQQKSRHFSSDELNRLRNAPLNRLINSIKNGNIQADTDLKIEELKDEEKAINLAIAKNLDALKEWKRKNENCLKQISNPSFIQSGIQLCNYNRFIESLDKGNESNIEAILHFINSNEKFLNRPATKAETALDELRLESAIDQTFSGLGKRVHCPEIKKEQSRIFIKNLKFSEEKNNFDTSGLKITCSNGKIKIDNANCEKNIEFVSDKLGEGVEIRSKKLTPNFTFKVEALGDCSAQAESVAPVLVAGIVKTQEQCNEESKKINKPLILNREKNSCEIKLPEVMTQQICDEKGKIEKKKLVLNSEKNTCEAALPDTKTEAICEEESKKEGKKLILNKELNTCEAVIEKGKTEAQCEEESKKEGKKLVLNKETNKCEAAVTEESKTAAQCEEESKKVGKKLVLNKETNKCEAAATEESKTAAQCEEESKKEGKKLVLNKETNKCEAAKEEVKAKLSKKELCEEKNELWISKAEDGEVRTNRHIWNEKTKSCDDKQEKKSSNDGEENPGKPEIDYGTTVAPPRFVPVNIPTRQMYILPGMP